MENNKLKNDLKLGAIIGGVLSVSFVLETMMVFSGNVNMYVLQSLLMLAVAVLHYYLLHRYTRSFSAGFSAEEGFSFGRGYQYIITLSAIAGLIVGVVKYLFLQVIIGYSTYMDRTIGAITDMLSAQGNIPASFVPMFSKTITDMQNTPEPPFYSTIFWGVASCVFFGALFGLIIAAVISRAPRPFDKQDNE